MVSDLIFKGEVHALKEIMSKSGELGMRTFDQALFDLYEHGQISYEDALRNADSVSELKLNIKLNSKTVQDERPAPRLELRLHEPPTEEPPGMPGAIGGGAPAGVAAD